MTACSAGADLTSSWSLGSRSDVVAAARSVPNHLAVSTLVPAGVSFRLSLSPFSSARDRPPSSTMARGRSRRAGPSMSSQHGGVRGDDLIVLAHSHPENACGCGTAACLREIESPERP
jgi:hypothetical protein